MGEDVRAKMRPETLRGVVLANLTELSRARCLELVEHMQRYGGRYSYEDVQHALEDLEMRGDATRNSRGYWRPAVQKWEREEPDHAR